MKIKNSSLMFMVTIAMATSCGQNTNKQLNNSSRETSIKNPIRLADSSTQKLDSTTYEILVTDHQSVVENFHILFKTGKYDNISLQDFVDKFREEFCTMKCNISLYDDRTIKSLVTKYPLNNKEYLKVADHFLATSTFEMNEVWLYPFQDIKYKELGGKNWKKEVMK